MAYSALYIMALICIIWGSLRSLRYVQDRISRKELIEVSIKTKEAKKFPFMASFVLFALYLIFKTNDGGVEFLKTHLDKARPYISEKVITSAESAIEYFKPLKGAERNVTAIIPRLLQKVGSYHPVLEKGVSYVPEVTKANLIFLLLLLLCWEGCSALAVILKPAFSAVLNRLPVGNHWPRRNVQYLLSLKRAKKEVKEGQLDTASKKDADYLIHGEYDTHLAIAFFFCSFIGLSHLYRRHWITNNLLGIGFAIYGIVGLHLASFKAGVLLLSGLFIYDVFWVFATDVMTTVAKGIDAPVLLMFPQDLLRNGWMDASKHGMLGLGDIVIPGIFVALLYRFDHYVGSKKGQKEGKKRYYFVITMIAYAVGLLTTMGVMHHFKAAQPALLYLVPTCVLIPLLAASIRGEFSELWNYSEEHLVEKKEDTAKAAVETEKKNK